MNHLMNVFVHSIVVYVHSCTYLAPMPHSSFAVFVLFWEEGPQITWRSEENFNRVGEVTTYKEALECACIL